MQTVHKAGEYAYDHHFSKKLVDVFDRAGSDKGSYHAYNEIYSYLFSKKEVTSFLEIGLFLHDNVPTTDLFAWAQIFPNAKIYGADRKRHLLFDDGAISTMYVDQDSNESFDSLKMKIGHDVDVILDDASHIFEKSINTFENLYEILSVGGIYIIEDILTVKKNEAWEQIAQEKEEIVDYFSRKGFDYEFFSTSRVDAVGDSSAIAVYK